MKKIVDFEERWKHRNKEKIQHAHADATTYWILQVAAWLKLFETVHGRAYTSIEELGEWVETLGLDEDEPTMVLTKSEMQEALEKNSGRLLKLRRQLLELE